jgi:hypothetical protein
LEPAGLEATTNEPIATPRATDPNPESGVAENTGTADQLEPTSTIGAIHPQLEATTTNDPLATLGATDPGPNNDADSVAPTQETTQLLSNTGLHTRQRGVVLMETDTDSSTSSKQPKTTGRARHSAKEQKVLPRRQARANHLPSVIETETSTHMHDEEDLTQDTFFENADKDKKKAALQSPTSESGKPEEPIVR